MASRFLSTWFIPALLAAAALAGAAPARAQASDVDASLVRLNDAKLQDTDTILGFAAEGAALYAKEPVKLSGYQYCSQSVSLAEAGEFRQSLRSAAKALHLARDTSDDNLVALATRDLAIVMSYAGELDKAEAFAREALKHQAKDPAVVVGPALKTIGDVQARRKDYAAAIASYDAAAAASSERFRPLVQASLANALVEAGELARARAVLEGVKLPQDNAALAPQLERTRARLLLAEGKPRESLAAYQALAARAGGYDAAYQRAWALEGVSNAQLALGERAAATEALDKALQGLDDVRARFRSEEVKTGLFSDLQGLFERAIGLALDQGDARRALDLSERSRARAFLDEVRGRAPVAGASLATVGVAQLQALLAPDERLLQFHALPDRLAAWVVSHDALRVVVLPLARDAVAKDVDEFRQAVTRGKGTAPQIAARLGAELIAPLRLTGQERLVVVPHGPLHYLPFQAMRVDGAWLVERHRVSVVPSMSIAAQLLARKPVVPARLLAFGNPKIAPKYDLPGADREVAEIARLFKASAVFTGADATRARFEQAAPAARIVHVAAHAEADLADPLHSRILLAGEAGPDGADPRFLDAADILRLDLSGVSLVTLSACESGLGRIASGDEVLGFPRSFLAAGTDALIASLWPVNDDATSLLMATAYARLTAGDDVQTAMQAAQLAVLRQPRFAHPFFWAPFNLIGNWRLALEH